MERAHLKIKGFYGQIPSKPDQLVDGITPVEQCIVLCHLGVPDIAAEAWTLQIGGLVQTPRTFGFRDLLNFPKHEVESVHQCAGSPLDPHRPTQRVCNVVWGGARLKDILDLCGVQPEVKFVWSFGADYGEFSGEHCDDYAKDFPIERLAQDVLVAYDMNGAPLCPENGFPARLVVPGYYGTNSVKWLTRMTLAPARAQGVFTTKWYNDEIHDSDGNPTGATEPVWALAPQSIIVAPGSSSALTANDDVDVWGWAWADGGIRSVEVSTDAGLTWRVARIENTLQRGWQKFSIAWPAIAKGRHVLLSRATGVDGRVQPLTGRRNAVFSVEIEAE